MDTFGSADRLAGYAGLAPVPRDSGRVSGNLRRPQRYHRGLLRSMYVSAMFRLECCSASKACYWRKRAEERGTSRRSWRRPANASTFCGP